MSLFGRKTESTAKADATGKAESAGKGQSPGRAAAPGTGETRGGDSAREAPGGRPAGVGQSGGGRAAASEGRNALPQSRPDRSGIQGGENVAHIGKSIVFKGDLSGDEDLEIDGTVDGRVDLPSHQLTIGAHGRVKAEVSAKSIVVVGHVSGNVSASERVEVQSSGVVEGDIRAPRLLIQEGAVVNGSVEMTKAAASAKPAAPASPTAPSPPSGGDARKASAG